MKKQLIAGNWKMNDLCSPMRPWWPRWRRVRSMPNVWLRPCVPALAQVQLLVAGTRIELGAQDASQHESGAFTDVSANMLREFAIRYCLVGHSERRQYHSETDAEVAAKAQRALAAGITPIVCGWRRWLNAKRVAPTRWSSASWPQ